MADFFTFFTLPRKLHLDVPALEEHFYTLSRKLHPDRFASRPQTEQDAALAQSSLLNDAYRTLKDPILRTQYLLTLEGVELEEQSKAATDAARTSGSTKKQIVPPDLLEEAFELNMQLEEMRMIKAMGGNDPQLRTDLLAAKQLFDLKMTETHIALERLWTKWDAAIDSGNTATKVAAKEAMVALLNRRSYLRNLVRDVNEALS